MFKKDVLNKSGDRWWISRSGPVFLSLVFTLCITFSFMAARWIVNVIYLYRPYLRLLVQDRLSEWKPIPESKITSWEALQNHAAIQALPTLYWGILLIGSLLSCWVVFRWYRRFHVINHHEYGTAEIATHKEVQKSAAKIPDRLEEFPGIGGVPIAHDLKHNLAGEMLKFRMIKTKGSEDRKVIEEKLKKLPTGSGVSGSYYIVQDTVNSLVIGITRSGKGEMFVNPLVDIISRAKVKGSMVIHDPKGELFPMSYETLRKRGYNVQVLNLDNMNRSMSYNPLAAAIEFAKRGNIEKTQQYVNSVSTAIYKKSKSEGSGGGNDSFWENSSISLLNALILALIGIANESGDWSKVTLRNAVEMLTGMGAQKIYVDNNGNILSQPDPNATQKSKLSVYFENFPKKPGAFRDQAFQSFQQSNFAGDETAGTIYSSAIAGVNLYLQDDIARLTSKNSIDLTSIGFPRVLRIKIGEPNLNNIYLNQIVNVSLIDAKGVQFETRNTVIDNIGYLSFPIKAHCPDHFTIKITFDNRDNPQKIRADQLVIQAQKIYRRQGINGKVVLDRYDHQPILERVEMNVVKESTRLIQSHINIQPEMKYSDKPIALFMVTPPHNPSYNMIVSFLVDQIFNLNYEMALQSGRKCFNRINFILDEFGNLPAINAMDTKVSIGLGQNISFNIVVQNLEQLTSKYGENVAASIQANCANLFYILTKSNKTAKIISEMAGKRTVNTATNNGNWNNMDNGSTHNQRTGQELFTVDELQKFQDGEMLVFRSTTRRSNSGFRIVSKPVLNLGNKFSMPSRWMFLPNFDESKTVFDIPVDTPHLRLRLKDIAINFDQLLEDQFDDLRADDGPDDETYGNDEVYNSESTTANRDVLFEPKQLHDKAFMATMSQYFMGLFAQVSRTTGGSDKFETVQQIMETDNFFNIPEYNSYAWITSIIGKKLAEQFKQEIKLQAKQFERSFN